MRDRAAALLSIAIVGAVSLATYTPRVGHSFPAMVDDWSAIAKSPEQLREVLLLGNPEDVRYRPGFVAWNALQWHTLGAPTERVGPQVWGLVRWALFVVGVTLLAALLVRSAQRRPVGTTSWSLVVGAGILAVTVPGIAVDLARFGPQEPLMVGCMSLGAVLLVRGLDRLLTAEPVRAATVALGLTGVVLWTFGVLQKESSACVLLMAPFLWPVARAQRERCAAIGHRRRWALAVLAGGILLPFVPMLGRTAELRLRGQRVYEEAAAAKSFTMRLSDQLTDADFFLHSDVLKILLGAAFVLLAASLLRVGADWISIGLVVAALAFLGFAATSGFVTSRYFIPVVALLALAAARLAASLGPLIAICVASLMIVGGIRQAHDARDLVQGWVEIEQAHETLVRAAAAWSRGGCELAVTGLNVEYVEALPVLVPLVDDEPHSCEPGSKYLIVLDFAAPGDATSTDDPTFAACAPEATPVWSSYLGRILRCTTWGAAAAAASV